MFLKNCKQCNKEFQAIRSNYSMCSNECTALFNKKNQTKYTEEDFQKAIALKLKGIITSEIVEQTGIKKPTLMKLFKERNIKLTPEQIKENTNRRWAEHKPIQDNKKQCAQCEIYKDVSDFYKSSNRLSGLTSGCIECYKAMYKERSDIIKARVNKYRKNNPSKIKERELKYYEENREKKIGQAAKWAAANKERAKEIGRRWGKNNQKYKNAKTAMRRAKKLQATPVWLTKEQLKEIENIYRSCPKGFHVDHIVPLQGENVSGLHTPWNLQIIPAEENLKKGNKF